MISDPKPQHSTTPPKVSILMLTHNAPRYVDGAIRSVVERTRNVEYELIVVDNASQKPTRDLLHLLDARGFIQSLTLLDYNSFFAEGNNIAAQHAAHDSTHFLLLNSDIEVKSSDWLSNLLAVHHCGISAYGVVENPLRVDGYCLLIDADLYRQHKLDEAHQFFWAVTKLQAAVLSQGYSVQGYAEHERYLHHFGGKSGKDFKAAKGLTMSDENLAALFAGNSIRILDALADGSLPQRLRKRLLERCYARVERLLA